MLPQLRLAICGGALLIALHLLAEYGLYVLIRYDTLTTAIVDQFQAVYNGPAANLLGIVLVACALGCSASKPGCAATAAMPASAPARRGTRRAHRSGARGLALAAAAAGRRPCFAVGLPLVTLLRWLWIRGGAERLGLAALGAALGQTAALRACSARS